MAETKLACMLHVHKPTEVLVLTMDGSPPCLQQHLLAEGMKRYFNLETKIEHIVVEQGKSYPIESIAVKTLAIYITFNDS
jgi:hypothetical protein